MASVETAVLDELNVRLRSPSRSVKGREPHLNGRFTAHLSTSAVGRLCEFATKPVSCHSRIAPNFPAAAYGELDESPQWANCGRSDQRFITDIRARRRIDEPADSTIRNACLPLIDYLRD